jgi:ribosomal protein S12 methylthiotransferase accessory factor
MTVDPTAKGYAYGTHRIYDPAETLAAISPHFAKMGLTRIADVTGLDSIGIPVCMAVRPNSKSLSVFQGKGLTLMLAKVSAAMEAIETWHAENPAYEVITATYPALSRETAVCDPASLNLHPRSVYHQDMTISWVKGYDLLQEEEIYVPSTLVHLSFLKGYDPLPMFYKGSNGLASGNHLLEAASHAICEVVERDATALWELGREMPEEEESILNLSTIDSNPAQMLLEKIERAGLDVFISNQTSNIGIPAFGCVIAERQPAGGLARRGNFGGYGCHLSKEVALLRAITEAAQSRLTHISGARDDMFRHTYLVQQQSGRNYQQWKGVMEKSQAIFDYRTLPSMETDSLAGDVALQLRLLKEAGLERVIMVDLSDPDIGIPVVRVIIPGAEYEHYGLHKRYGRRAEEQTMRALVKKYFIKQLL